MLTDAKKERIGAVQALALAREAAEIVVVKGKKVLRIDMKNGAPGDAELLKVLLGPSGNLRAPTLRKGKTLLVGFEPDAYTKVFRPPP